MSTSNPAAARPAIALVTDIVAAYVAHNPVPTTELPGLIARIHGSVVELMSGAGSALPVIVEMPNAGQIRASVQRDGIVSFIDGRSYKTLKRHLTAHGLTPDSYRARYGLPDDYPLVAPSYAAQRSALAKGIGLGRPGGLAEHLASRKVA